MRINLKSLLNTRFATVVKNAMDNGELDLFNMYSWTIAYNSGMKDARLLKEVETLVEYYTYH